MTEQSDPLPFVPVHQWTHGGDRVLILRCAPNGGKSTNDFQWPMRAGETTKAPDANRVAECGHGLHGWPWGTSVGDGIDPYFGDQWLVFSSKPEDVIDLGGKVKAVGEVHIECVGTYLECLLFLTKGQIAWTQQHVGAKPKINRSASTNTGDQSASTNTGNRSASTNTGDQSASTNTGDRGVAVVTGIESTVECGLTGLAVTTADIVRWKVRPGAVLCQRTEKGAWLLFADEWEWDEGEILTVAHGVIWRKWL